jgi:hypothetical protein
MVKFGALSAMVQLIVGNAEFLEVILAARPPAPDGKACKELTDEECCQYSDATMYTDQDCVPAVSGRKFSSGATCEAECFVGGGCGAEEAASSDDVGDCPETTTTATTTVAPETTTGQEMRPIAPDGQACSDLSLKDCCKYADGSTFTRQNCIRASDGKKYSDGSQCQSKCWVEGTCGAGDEDGAAGDCEDLPQPTTEAPTSQTRTYTPRPGPDVSTTTGAPSRGGSPGWAIALLVIGGVAVVGGAFVGLRRQVLTRSIRGTELRGLNN